VMRKGKNCNLKVRSAYLLVIMKMSKAIEFFNQIVVKLLLEEMLNLMKISWLASLIHHLCLLFPTIHLQCFCILLFLFWFLLQMMAVRMKIHLYLLTFLHMNPSNLNLHQLQLHCFLDGFVQHEKKLVIFLVILHINVECVHISENHDPETFAEASSHPNWDITLNEEYHYLMENDTWDVVPLPKGRKLVICK
jgi:hypothetical protein